MILQIYLPFSVNVYIFYILTNRAVPDKPRPPNWLYLSILHLLALDKGTAARGDLVVPRIYQTTSRQPGILRRRSYSVEQLAVRHSNCFFCDNFQESTQDSFIYPVILHNIISSVYCCSDFMDMLRRLINNCRIIINKGTQGYWRNIILFLIWQVETQNGSATHVDMTTTNTADHHQHENIYADIATSTGTPSAL